MIRYSIAFLVLVALTSLGACAENPEGRFGCSNSGECPSGWSCRVGVASTELRCYSSEGEGTDAGDDVSVADARSDVSGRDGGPDSATVDGGVPLDTGADVGTEDAGMADTGVDASCDAFAPVPDCTDAVTLRLGSVSVEGLIGGGVEGMDQACATAFDGPFKALVLSSTRFPGVRGETAQDWVLESNTCYANESGQVLFRTNDDRVSSSGVASGPLSPESNFWTGSNQDWTPNDQNCDDWTNPDGGPDGGPRGMTGFNVRRCALKPFIGDHGTLPCNVERPVLCVEQLTE